MGLVLGPVHLLEASPTEDVHVVDTNADNILEYGVCGYKNIKRAGLSEKVAWLKARWPEGLKVKTLFSDKDGTQGMIEYLPGEYCWRPVDATGYMFIHCIFVGFKKAYKGKGYGSLLLQECLEEARKRKMHGVAAVTRKGSFMAGKAIFAKHGFTVVDRAIVKCCGWKKCEVGLTEGVWRLIQAASHARGSQAVQVCAMACDRGGAPIWLRLGGV